MSYSCKLNKGKCTIKSLCKNKKLCTEKEKGTHPEIMDGGIMHFLLPNFSEGAQVTHMAGRMGLL